MPSPSLSPPTRATSSTTLTTTREPFGRTRRRHRRKPAVMPARPTPSASWRCLMRASAGSRRIARALYMLPAGSPAGHRATALSHRYRHRRRHHTPSRHMYVHCGACHLVPPSVALGHVLIVLLTCTCGLVGTLPAWRWILSCQRQHRHISLWGQHSHHLRPDIYWAPVRQRVCLGVWLRCNELL